MKPLTFIFLFQFVLCAECILLNPPMDTGKILAE
jgi:hypothetical protein